MEVLELTDNNISSKEKISGKVEDSFEYDTLHKYLMQKLNVRKDELQSVKGGTYYITDEDETKELKIPSFKKNPVITNNKNYFSKSQKWLGHVQEIKEGYFTARLKDLTNGGTDEFCEFDMDLVTEDDMDLLKPGAAFYWTIGIENKGTTISNSSVIRFQRLILWDFNDFVNASDSADSLANKLKWK